MRLCRLFQPIGQEKAREVSPAGFQNQFGLKIISCYLRRAIH
jgi:hypothetical protein